MKRLNGDSVCLFVCLAVLAASPVFAASITVTNTNDNGAGSLRDAIANAAPGDTINFNLTYPATITLSSALHIGTNLTISGPGASNLAVSGGGAVQVFSIGSGVTATISGVTVENGFSSFPDYGGGIYNNGTLTVSSSAFSGNTASYGGGIYNNGILTVNGSTLSGNAASLYGGGYGGALYNAYYATLTVTNSTISVNSAPIAAGIDNLGTMIVANSTLYGNFASGSSGGINNSGSGIVKNSTLWGNNAYSGGGISNGGPLTISNSTFSQNSATSLGGTIFSNGPLTMKNTILANSFNGGNCFLGFLISSGGYNLSDDPTCHLVGTGDMNGTPAGLDPNGLRDNGGPTWTIGLQATSPALDAIPVSAVNYCTEIDGVTPVATDQRGVARPQGFGCDIGAYERKGFSSFSANLELGSGKQGGFSLNAAFTLSAGSAPIDPLTQAVRLQIGPYMVTIPAGSFHQAQGSNTGSWAFAGSINGVKLSVQIAASGSGSYQFKATGSPVDFSGVSNPVTVAIGIGVDAGSTQLIASF